MRRLAAIAALILTLAAASDARALSLTDNLAGYWQFESNGADTSGNGRNLTFAGGVATGSGGVAGSALVLPNDGTQHASRATNDTVFDLGSADFTIQVWAKFNEVSQIQTLFEKFTNPGGPGWSLSKVGGPAVEFYANSGGSVYLNTGAMTITTGAWHQIVVRRNASTWDIFYDDVSKQQITNSNAITGSSNPLHLGGRYDGDATNVIPVDGALDEVAVWTRALSNAEIDTLWNGGQGFAIAAVPEPASLALLGLGALAGARRRCRKKPAG